MFQGLRLAALLAGLSLPAAAIVVPIGPVSDFEAYGDLFFNGVGRLTITKTTGSVGCSGSLLSTGYHVLTAAHCVTDSSGVLNATAATAEFPTGIGPVFTGITVTNFVVHPSWTGALGLGDLAILELVSMAPAALTRYDLYSGSMSVHDVVTLAGYGQSGVGAANGSAFPFGTLRRGNNTYDGIWVIGSFVTDAIATDFDNGNATNNLIGLLTGNSSAGLGLGNVEVNIGPGDSGGPMFRNGMLLGVASFGLCVAFPNSSGCVFPARREFRAG